MLIPPPLHAYPHDLVRVHIYTRLPEDEYLIAPVEIISKRKQRR